MATAYHIWADSGKRAAVGIGLISGSLVSLAYPSCGWWVLALVGYVPLLRWLQAAQPTWRRALLAGWSAGLVLHMVAYAFLAFTCQEMSGMPAALGWLLVAVHAAAMALHQGLFAVAVAWSNRQGVGALRRAGEVALILAVCEFLPPWLFRWYLGSAFFRAPVLVQAADIVGTIGVSALAIAVASLLARAWSVRSWQPLGLAGMVVALWASYGALRIYQVDHASATGTWRAVVVQQNATLAEKKALDAPHRLPALDRLEAMTLQAKRDGKLATADAVIWPEGAFPFFWVPDDVTPVAGVRVPTKANRVLLRTKKRVLDLANQLPVPLLMGTLRRFDPMWRQEARNSAIVVDRSGVKWVYDKQILLAFGEYLPGTRLLPQFKEAIPGVSNFDEGTTSGLVQLGKAKVLVNICYEALFSDFMRSEAQDAQVLINLTNDVWFGPPPAPDLHLMVQHARAVELRRPLVRSTVNGISAVVDAAGRFTAEAGHGVQQNLEVAVPLADIGSPYRLWGDAPLWLLSLLAVVGGALLHRRRKLVS